MVAVLDDPRVVKDDWHQGAYTVTLDGDRYRVIEMGSMGWCVYAGPDLNLVRIGDGFATHFVSAEAAVAALLGVTP